MVKIYENFLKSVDIFSEVNSIKKKKNQHFYIVFLKFKTYHGADDHDGELTICHPDVKLNGDCDDYYVDVDQG